MTAQLRLILLVLTLTYALVFGPTGVLAAGKKMHLQRVLRVRSLRVNFFHPKEIAPPTPIGVRAVRYAKRFLGVPYVWGGSTPSGFDCSGLVRYVYERFGIDLPHSSYADFNLGRPVSRRNLKPGDLVFFNGVGHVGLYIGSGRFIHAPNTGTRVQISTIDSGWGGYDGARRIVAGAKRRLLHG